jgi:hypothetical protein
MNVYKCGLIVILKSEWCDRLLEDFKNIFTALKSCEVMNKTVYQKCLSQVMTTQFGYDVVCAAD